MAICCLIPLLFQTAVFTQDVQMVRDGDYWVRTEAGPVGLASIRALKVTTGGHVILRGSANEQPAYKLVERVKARNLEEAHHLFGRGFGRGGSISVTKIVSTPGMTTLMVASFANEIVMTQLELSVPRRLANVTLDVRPGDVEAYDLDGNVHIDTTAGMIHCDRIRGGVDGNTGGGEIRLGKIGGPVRCVSAAGSIIVDSAGGDAMCQTAGGEIQIHEAGGRLDLATEGGNIQVDKAASTVEAHTGEGVIEVFQAGGAVFADTRGGSIQIGSAQGVKCQSAAGAIRVKTGSGPLRVQTAMGSILAEVFAGAHLEDASLVAGSGDITVLIPSNLALSVLARNDTGGNPRIVSDFSEVRAKPAVMRRAPLVFEGSINGGGPLLTLNTSGGIIYVRKLK
jgi:DUF4097 and DUF4098 domain-containing protein YvlB